MWQDLEKEEYPLLVSPQWLQRYIKNNEDKLGDPKLRILDGSWHPPTTKRSGLQEWETQHIIGALFFDVTKCVDTDTKLKLMPPPFSEFADYVGKLGINNDTHVVVYDNNEMIGMMSSPRVWWLFKLFGHDRVSILDGGMPAWKRATKLPQNLATALVQEVEPQQFKAQFRPDLVKSFEDVVENVEADEKKFQLVDARPKLIFEGTAAGPPGQAPGHVRGAYNIPSPSVMDQKTKTVKGEEALRKTFEGINLSHPISVMCFAGLSACNLALALHLLRVPKAVALYEGSWIEWGPRADDTMIAMGPHPEEIRPF